MRPKFSSSPAVGSQERSSSRQSKPSSRVGHMRRPTTPALPRATKRGSTDWTRRSLSPQRSSSRRVGSDRLCRGRSPRSRARGSRPGKRTWLHALRPSDQLWRLSPSLARRVAASGTALRSCAMIIWRGRYRAPWWHTRARPPTRPRSRPSAMDLWGSTHGEASRLVSAVPLGVPIRVRP